MNNAGTIILCFLAMGTGFFILVITILYFVFGFTGIPHCFGMRVYVDQKLKVWEWIYHRWLWWFEKKRCQQCECFTFTPAPYEDGWDGECDLKPDKCIANFGTCPEWKFNIGELRVKDIWAEEAAEGLAQEKQKNV